MPEIQKYEPKPLLEKYRVGENLLEMDAVSRCVTITGTIGEITLDYETIPDLVQFLAWAMRERMEVTADAESEKVRKPEDIAERGGI